MIGDLMLYGAKIALLIGIAAVALERVAAWRGLARRSLWAAALILSVALPAAAVLMPDHASAASHLTQPFFSRGAPQATVPDVQAPFTAVPSIR